MDRIQVLKQRIGDLYGAKHPERADWADWLYANHVLIVGDYAEQLAERYGARKDLAVAAALLHDVADAVMQRENPLHEETSFDMARQLLRETGFNEEEVALIVDDAIRFHSCKDGQSPRSLEGKVMAAADGVAHVATDFYDFGIQKFNDDGESTEATKAWGLPKIERDYWKKISFEDLRKEHEAGYERVKALFTAL
jgi:hypothetical protein